MEDYSYKERKITGGYGAFFANFILLIIMILLGTYGALHILEKGREANGSEGVVEEARDFYTSDNILEEEIKVLVEIDAGEISEEKIKELVNKIAETEDIDGRKIDMLSKEIGL